MHWLIQLNAALATDSDHSSGRALQAQVAAALSTAAPGMLPSQGPACPTCSTNARQGGPLLRSPVPGPVLVVLRMARGEAQEAGEPGQLQSWNSWQAGLHALVRSAVTPSAPLPSRPSTLSKTAWPSGQAPNTGLSDSCTSAMLSTPGVWLLQNKQ